MRARELQKLCNTVLAAPAASDHTRRRAAPDTILRPPAAVHASPATCVGSHDHVRAACMLPSPAAPATPPVGSRTSCSRQVETRAERTVCGLDVHAQLPCSSGQQRADDVGLMGRCGCKGHGEAEATPAPTPLQKQHAAPCERKCERTGATCKPSKGKDTPTTTTNTTSGSSSSSSHLHAQRAGCRTRAAPPTTIHHKHS